MSHFLSDDVSDSWVMMFSEWQVVDARLATLCERHAVEILTRFPPRKTVLAAGERQ
jgi:hypothetical protein